jgi:hypothetical protein
MCTRMEWSNAVPFPAGAAPRAGWLCNVGRNGNSGSHTGTGLWSSSGLLVQDNSAKYVSGPVRIRECVRAAHVIARLVIWTDVSGTAGCNAEANCCPIGVAQAYAHAG